MKILITDDSRVMRQIVIRTLRQAGYGHATIIEATDGGDAMAKFAESAPDLVLSDWNMPEVSGLDLLHGLRNTGYTGPFGFVTSEGSPQMREVAAAAGADFLLAKPFTPEALGEHIEDAMSASRA